MSDVTVRVSPNADAILREAVRPKMVLLAKVMKGEILHLVPVLSGDLYSTVEVEVDEDGNIIGTAGDTSRGIDYARYVEDGTYRMKAQPYMRPVFERRRGKI